MAGNTKQDMIAQLEKQVDQLRERIDRLKHSETVATQKKKRFDFDGFYRRKIALKFSYEGWHYCGLAMQSLDTPLPTVEQKIYEALVTARLIDPNLSLSDSGFSRCGRTDRGVSSSGQVVSLWVRSALKPPHLPDAGTIAPGSAIPYLGGSMQDAEFVPFPRHPPPAPPVYRSEADAEGGTPEGETPKPVQEIEYAYILNRILPPSIKVSAWSPVDALFDARFSCLGRHYKYFFVSKPGQELDVDKMQEAANLLVGEHDFRNLCKIDASKQIVNFRRAVHSAVISPLDVTSTTHEKHYVLDLQGSAFLYHQVRHIMALLFLVGSGMEPPSLISTLLDVEATPTKPEYEMAHEIPLLLYECQYNPDVLNWQHDDTVYEQHQVHMEPFTIQQIVRHHNAAQSQTVQQNGTVLTSQPATCIQLGAGTRIRTNAHKYVPILKRPRGDHYELANARYLEKVAKRREAASQSNVVADAEAT